MQVVTEEQYSAPFQISKEFCHTEKASFIHSGWPENMHDYTVTGRKCRLLTINDESFWSGCWTGSKTHTMLP